MVSSGCSSCCVVVPLGQAAVVQGQQVLLVAPLVLEDVEAVEAVVARASTCFFVARLVSHLRLQLVLVAQAVLRVSHLAVTVGQVLKAERRSLLAELQLLLGTIVLLV